MDFFCIHLGKTSLSLFPFLCRIFFLCTGTLQNKQIKSHKRSPFKPQSLRAVGQSISKIGACPVEYRHEVISNNHNATFCQITQALFIVLYILQIVSCLSLNILVYGHAFNDTPSQPHLFYHFFALHDFLYRPHFPIGNMMQGSNNTGCTGLFDVP